mmetsp:Transcript_531/g.1633  ORF Transcript_531/g.1633 Transcript_531/m.1633 type:complete len:228 (+) Transcript_531:549-1232(+)
MDPYAVLATLTSQLSTALGSLGGVAYDASGRAFVSRNLGMSPYCTRGTPSTRTVLVLATDGRLADKPLGDNVPARAGADSRCDTVTTTAWRRHATRIAASRQRQHRTPPATATPTYTNVSSVSAPRSPTSAEVTSSLTAHSVASETGSTSTSVQTALKAADSLSKHSTSSPTEQEAHSGPTAAHDWQLVPLSQHNEEVALGRSVAAEQLDSCGNTSTDRMSSIPSST